MYLKKFQISFFRSFAAQQTLSLGVPKLKCIGSGITYMVGENNSGKTTIIEGITMRHSKKIRSSEKQSVGTPHFEFINEEGQTIRTLSLIRPESYTMEEKLNDGGEIYFECIPSRRHWESKIGGSGSKETMLLNSSNDTIRSPESKMLISFLLKEIESNNSKYDEFIEYVKSVVPDFNSFAIGYENEEYVEYETKDGARHKSDFFGDGIISLLRILVHLFNKSPRPLIIDEPELSLHPAAQVRLLKLIAKESESRQIIISTHSPYFINWRYIKNGATLNKVSKNNDLQSLIHTLSNYSIYEKLINGANWQQPFLMDIVAKEIFFNDNILFVEGQEDVGLIRQEHVLSEDVNIFGYGVRGINSFELALTLARDLGVVQAAVLLDHGEEEQKVKDSLLKKFPKYKVIMWNRNDIRDKKIYTSKQKTGYFTVKGKIKPKEDLDDFYEKINIINTYFQDNSV